MSAMRINRRLPLLVAALLAAVVAVVVAAASSPAAVAAKRKPHVFKVKVADDFFSPTKLTIHAGDKVNFVWANTNVDTHNVELISAPKQVNRRKLSSGSASTEFHFEVKLTVPGKYHFRCNFHPTMMNIHITVKR